MFDSQKTGFRFKQPDMLRADVEDRQPLMDLIRRELFELQIVFSSSFLHAKDHFAIWLSDLEYARWLEQWLDVRPGSVAIVELIPALKRFFRQRYIVRMFEIRLANDSRLTV